MSFSLLSASVTVVNQFLKGGVFTLRGVMEIQLFIKGIKPHTKSRGYCDCKRHNSCRMKMMISVDIMLMTFRLPINSKQNSVQSLMLPQLQHEMIKGQVKIFIQSQERARPLINANRMKHHLNSVHSSFCFKLRAIHRPTLVELLSYVFQSSHAAFNRE